MTKAPRFNRQPTHANTTRVRGEVGFVEGTLSEIPLTRLASEYGRCQAAQHKLSFLSGFEASLAHRRHSLSSEYHVVRSRRSLHRQRFPSCQRSSLTVLTRFSGFLTSSAVPPNSGGPSPSRLAAFLPALTTEGFKISILS